MPKNRAPFTTRRMTFFLAAAALGGAAAISFAPALADDGNAATHGASTAAQAGPFDVTNLSAAVNETFGLTHSEIAFIDPAVDGVVFVPFEQHVYTLVVHEHSVRAAGHRVRAQIDDGSLLEVDPGPVNTVRGVVEGVPGATVAGALLDEGLFASIVMPDGRAIWVEPLVGVVEGALPGMHVVYDGADADCEGVCGVTAAMELEQFMADLPIDQDGPRGEVCKVAEVAIDADFHYFQARGSSVTNVVNRINNIVNTLNVQYETQVGIIHEITEIIVRTSSAENPYTSNNPSTLLNQFRNEWNSPPESSIHRDVAHLFTGRNLGNVLGIAWVGVICHSSNGYGLSVNLNNFSCATDLTAHELGHNWNAGHCSCPNHTMNSGLTCSNNFHPTATIPTIIAFRNSRGCLHDCFTPEPPANNECQNAIAVGGGSTPFNNIDATTTGPAEPQMCDLFGDDDIRSDVWFTHVANCTGELTVRTCGSDFLTKIAVYGSQCPTQPGSVLACATVGCPMLDGSSVTLPVVQGQTYIIRVGGHLDAQGEGVLTITCNAISPDCPGDINGDGAIDLADLSILLENFGTAGGPEDGDINGDGMVDLADLSMLLEVFGTSCD